LTSCKGEGDEEEAEFDDEAEEGEKRAERCGEYEGVVVELKRVC
jgi:hypothetical protein